VLTPSRASIFQLTVEFALCGRLTQRLRFGFLLK
jgi:hypothetical protein